jgi:hypothetical protein
MWCEDVVESVCATMDFDTFVRASGISRMFRRVSTGDHLWLQRWLPVRRLLVRMQAPHEGLRAWVMGGCVDCFGFQVPRRTLMRCAVQERERMP